MLALALTGLFGATSIGYAAYLVSRDSVGVPVTKLKPAPKRLAPPGARARNRRSEPPPSPPAPRTTTVDDDGDGGRGGNSGKGSGNSGRGGGDDD